MLVNIGPKQREKNRIKNSRSVKKKQVIFLLSFLLLPIIVFSLFFWKPIKWDIFNSGPKLEENILHAVAMIEFDDGLGSGFLVSDKYVITASHVVEYTQLYDTILVSFEKANKMDLKAVVVFKGDLDKMSDYAVLELVESVDIVPLEIGSSKDVTIKTPVNVIGYPGGLFSSTFGAISNDELTDYPDLLQLDAGAWPGNSGGPIIIDGTNQVIGILIMGLEGEYKGIVWGIKIDALLNDIDFQQTDINFLIKLNYEDFSCHNLYFYFSNDFLSIKCIYYN